MSSASNEEYRKALEALEAIQRHAFEISSQQRQGTVISATDEPPPETDVELEEAVSDDDVKSERSPGAASACRYLVIVQVLSNNAGT